jgi:ribose 5-phosphate isomerase B
MQHLFSIPTDSSAAHRRSINRQWRIVIGSDDAGSVYRAALQADLDSDPRVAQIIDAGAQSCRLVTYERVAVAAARLVQQGYADRALLISGSGLGVAMSANRVRGIRAVIACDSASVQRSVLDTDAQVLCLGYRVIDLQVARRLTDEWLDYRFDCLAARNVAVM